MEKLQINGRGEVMLPTFPRLRSALEIASKEADLINNQVLPALRREGFTDGMLSTRLIMEAAQTRGFLPKVPKLALNYGNFMRYTGKSIYFDRARFMEHYDTTAEGRERLEILKQYEEQRASAAADKDL